MKEENLPKKKKGETFAWPNDSHLQAVEDIKVKTK